MDLYGKRFIYAGTASSTYGLYISSITSSIDTVVVGSASDSTFYGKKNIRKYILGTSWESSPRSFTVEMTRTSPFTNEELRAAERWLFKHNDYEKLYIDPDDDPDGITTERIDGVDKRLYLNCKLTNPSKLMYAGGVVGFTCTIECDSAFVWQDAITKTLEPANATNGVRWTISTEFDYVGFIYPRVVLLTGSTGGDITIVNNSDDSSRITKFVSLPANQQIVMNGAVNYISGNNYIRFDGGNFVRFVDGSNVLNITGDVASISVTWSNVRYM